MRYSVGFRKDVLEAIAKGMPKKEASRRFNINLSTIKEWCRSCGVEPGIAVGAVKRKRLSAEERAAAVSRVEAGEPISAVAREAGVTYQAVYRWLCSKKQPDGIYYTQEDGCMDRHENVEDLKLEVKALREEVEYLTAKAAYLDALLELSGIPAGKFKKKEDARPSAKRSGKALEA